MFAGKPAGNYAINSVTGLILAQVTVFCLALSFHHHEMQKTRISLERR